MRRRPHGRTGCGTSSEGDDKSADKQPRATAARVLPDAKMRSAWPKEKVPRGLAKDMRLPLETYMLGYPDEADVENAKDRVKAACMKRHGFTFTPTPTGAYPPPSYNDANMERRYGITDRQTAQTLGYGVPQDQGDPPVDLAEDESRSDKWDATFNDVCVPEANAKIGILHETDLAAELSEESYTATRQDADVVKAVTTWASCMKSKGYEEEEPEGAASAFAPAARSARGVRAESAEVKAAVADVDCKEQSGLVSTWHTAEVAYQTKQIKDNKSALEAERAKDQKMIEAASAVLGQS
ncbi:hypothetical protein RB200_04385 [Streptomyces sp. PmtG]